MLRTKTVSKRENFFCFSVHCILKREQKNTYPIIKQIMQFGT